MMFRTSHDCPRMLLEEKFAVPHINIRKICKYCLFALCYFPESQFVSSRALLITILRYLLKNAWYFHQWLIVTCVKVLAKCWVVSAITPKFAGLSPSA